MIRRYIIAATVVAALLVAPSLHAEDAEPAPLKNGNFSFDRPLGQIDKAAAQRGLQIYKEVCSACHGLYELSYRNIEELGYTPDQAKAFAADYKVPDLNDQGEPTERTALPSDKFVRPFPNFKAARAANNGALPPDLALIAKSRKGGATYPYSLLQGYRDPPADVKMGDGMYYNIYFPGHQIAMPPPLADGVVTFADGSPNDLDHEAHDVATFLEWAANPEIDERKQMGVKVVLFLVVLSVVLYLGKRYIWRDVH
jgi:ubiquinol-cytochrome c reductase cytochrome c1 subunit